MSAALSVLAFSVLGAGVSAVLACLPGLHVYNVIGLAVLAVHAVTGGAAIAAATSSLAWTRSEPVPSSSRNDR